MLAQSGTCRKRATSRTTIGERLIAAISASRPAPAIGSGLVIIDALPSLVGTSWTLGEGCWATTPPGPWGFPLTPVDLVAARTISVRINIARKRVRLTAPIWRSCGGASKSLGVTSDYPFRATSNLRRYRDRIGRCGTIAHGSGVI